jgi:hypothetical protein
MAREKSTFTRYKTLAFCVVGLLVAWQFLKLPEMIDAVLTFFLAGVVPGTHVVLSPNTVMLLSAIGVGIVVVAVVLTPIIKHILREKHEQADSPEAVEFQELVPHENATPEPVRAPVTPAEAFQQQMYVAAATAVAETNQPTSTVGILMNQAGDGAAASLDRVMPRLLTSTIKAGVWLRPRLIAVKIQIIRAYYIAKRYTKIGLRWTVKELKLFWRWLLPRLKQFDRWLELQIRRLERRIRG